MITIPNTLQKDQALTFSLNKTELFAAITDDYFSIESNVQKAIFVYRSEDGHQRKRIEFLIADASPSDTVTFSSRAKDVFELEEIVLIDYDNGTHVLHPSAVSSSERTLNFVSGPTPSTVYFAFDGTSDSDLDGFGSVYDSSVGGEFYPL